MVAAKRSLELLDHALVTAYQAYSQHQPTSARSLERRRQDQPIGFPERRFSQPDREVPNTEHLILSVH